ncbi:MAG: hypothetical protein AAF317_04305 [Pseudomonadota bacterium]
MLDVNAGPVKSPQMLGATFGSILERFPDVFHVGGNLCIGLRLSFRDLSPGVADGFERLLLV